MGLVAYFRQLFSSKLREAELQRKLEELQKESPVPVFWLFGKTQSGKTSVIKYLTAAEDAEIGAGFKPTTRFSRQYRFPTEDAPLMTFLDTRGLDEPGYDSAEDIDQFQELAHVLIVTVRVMDHAQERVLTHVERIRKSRPQRPVVLALTCLHEGYPQQQHPDQYPYHPLHLEDGKPVEGPPLVPDDAPVGQDLRRSIAEQVNRFGQIVDWVVPVDFTKPEEGFSEAQYGGEALKQTLLQVLPEAYRQTLIAADRAGRELRDWHERRALPFIIGYSTLAASAGAVPVPFVDLLILPSIQTRMVYHLAQLYGQSMSGKRFLEMSSSLGMGLLVRQVVREVAKFIPGVGPVVGAALAATSTYALGKAACYYYSSVLAGHVPPAEELRGYYQKQLRQAETAWRVTRQEARKDPLQSPT